eukprot:TRINITY_DN1780_c0_g1_i1.p2 TRINITY_DN1780_c0_g1~~TRINITY_DN1780_c0_g1_i1.p2  ORF type:complete len:425 (-),score=115.92 TRINITY_DN1780_c0_g1_i1:2-1276(-)
MDVLDNILDNMNKNTLIKEEKVVTVKDEKEPSVEDDMLVFCFTGNCDELRRLFEENKDEDEGVVNVNIDYQDPHGCTGLFFACQQNHYYIVELIFQHFKHVDVNLRTNAGTNALFVATLNNNMDIVRLLLKKRANPNIYNFYRDCPLLNATFNNNIEMAELLLRKRANPNPIRVEKKIFDQEMGELDENDENNNNSNNNNNSIIKKEKKEKIKIQEIIKPTPLFLASERGQIEIAQLLLCYKADVTNNKINNISPRDIAKRNKHRILVVLLDNPILNLRYSKKQKFINESEDIDDEIGQWLTSIRLKQYTDNFLQEGFNNLESIVHLNYYNLNTELNIHDQQHINIILQNIHFLNVTIKYLSSDSNYSTDDNLALLEKQVRITSGNYKGYMGKVTQVSISTYAVYLFANDRIITVPFDHVCPLK